MILRSLQGKLATARRLAPYLRHRATRDSFVRGADKINRFIALSLAARRVGRAYHRTLYNSLGWKNSTWFGVPIQQFPTDLYLYQEIIAAQVPDYIVQTGVYDGGSALFLAHLLDMAGAPATALVIAVDIELRPCAKALAHPRVRLIEGSSTAPEVIQQIERLIEAIPSTTGGMVSLDSDHSARHVARELQLYPRFVGVGHYLVVEDTTVNGRPVFKLHGPGPGEALDAWLPHHPEFERDDELWQRQLFSAHAGGWLKRAA